MDAAPAPHIPGVLNENWQGAAVARARALYPNQGLHSTALLMARSHRFAIDYMEQCPAVAVFATWGKLPRRADERVVVATRFGSAVNRGPKLKDLMAGFNGPVQIRKLSGAACIPSNFKAILALRMIAPSDLAQAIPDDKGQQLVWMRLLREWLPCIHRSRLASTDWKFRLAWEWMVKAGSIAVRGGVKKPEDHVSTIIDMIHHGGIEINPAWTFQGALAAADRWHTELAQKRDQQKFLRAHGFGFEDKRDYGPLPLAAHFGDLTFTALQSGLDLYLEGAAMRHCVASYVREVMLGGTRIYSIRRGEDRVATVELVPQGRTYRMGQLKGPCNRNVLKADAKLVAEFVASCNAAILTAAGSKGQDWTKPAAYLGGDGQ